MTAPDRIALRWETGAAVTSGPLMDHPDYTQYVRAEYTRAPLAEALAVVLEALKDGEVWGRAVNGASAVLNSGMPEEYWTRPKEIREAITAALRAIGEPRNG